MCVCSVYGMNPSVSCSSEEQAESSWVCESWENNPSAMSVGLETARAFQGGGRVVQEWEWDNNPPNPVLFSHHRHHHHHHHHQSDSQEQKPQILSASPHVTPTFRQYNGMGFSHNAVGVMNSGAGNRSFAGGGSNDGIPSSSSFHPGLLYSEMSGFGGYSDSGRSLEQHRQLFGMMNMEHCKGGGLHDIVKREEVYPGDFQARIGLNLGHRTYFSTEDTAVSRLYKRPRAIPPGSQIPRCQAEGCKADLSNAKHYHRRHKVCELHSKATSVITGGLQQRFCQQCSRFHVLAEFDDVKRSCRKRLADHNRRRRKPQPSAVASTASSAEATALKVEEEDNINGSTTNHNRGLQASPILRTEAQALVSAMSISSSLPLMLQNTKGHVPSVLQATTSQKVVPCQQYAQSAGGQKGPNLSLSSSVGGGGSEMGLCNERQTTTQDYNGLELALPWLRPSSEFGTSTGSHGARPPMDVLQPIIPPDKSNVEAYSSSIQNFLPLNASSRELGSSQWMVGGGTHNNSNLEAGQQMFSLLEAPAVRTEDSSQQSHTRPVEYLSHHHHHHHHHHHRHDEGGLNSNESVGGHSDAKFSDMQSLRPFGHSMYDADL
eukprot:Gb_15605 [translate_table: standard]